VIGWRLVPAREASRGESFHPDAYVTEVRIPAKSKASGLTLRSFENELEDNHAVMVGLLRNDVRMTVPHGGRHIKENDILVLEAEVNALAEALSVFRYRIGRERVSD